MNKLNHIAFIMDGNGRWGKKKGKGRNFGHLKGVETVKKIVKGSIKLNIPIITFYVFSSENWKRPKNEINYLFSLLHNFLTNKIDELNKEKIRLFVIGKKKFSKNLNNLLKYSENLTSKNKRLQINLALNYGSKEEIVSSVKKTINSARPINEANINKNLYTADIPDPEILIRTGNRYRLSNFLLWQTSYTEIFFVKKLWPDFNKNDFNKIISKFKNMRRNFGGIK